MDETTLEGAPAEEGADVAAPEIEETAPEAA